MHSLQFPIAPDPKVLKVLQGRLEETIKEGLLVSIIKCTSFQGGMSRERIA